MTTRNHQTDCIKSRSLKDATKSTFKKITNAFGIEPPAPEKIGIVGILRFLYRAMIRIIKIE